MTRENQNYVAYQQVKHYKEQGLTPVEIDALWNGAHKGPDGKYVHNAPDRAEKFRQALAQQIGGGGGLPPAAQPGQVPQQLPGMPLLAQAAGVSGAPMVPDAGAGFPTEQPQGHGFFNGIQQDLAGTNPDSAGTQIENTIKGVGNFLFPIGADLYHDVKGDNSKTGLQQFGDAALSALPFIPGLGEVGEGARGAEAAGMLSKLRALPVAVKGAGVGYGAGVASNLSQGKGVGESLMPNASTLGGAALGGLGGALASKLGAMSGEEGTINKIRTAYDDALGATKTGIRASSKVSARGAESPAEFLANAGIPPETEQVNGRVVFKTGEDSETYKTIQDRASTLTKLRDDLIDTAPEDAAKLTSLSSLQNTILKQINRDFLGTDRVTAENHILKEFETLKSQMGDQLTLKQFNNIKKYFQGNTNYDATRPTTLTEANKVASALTRKEVERLAEKSGVPGIKSLNKVIQQHLDFLNTDGKKGILHKLNGQVVKNGRIGIHVKEMVGAGAGAALGGAFGGGPLGEAAGAIGGGVAGNVIAKLLQRLSVGGPMTAARIGKMAQEDPQIVQDLAAELERRTGNKQGLIAPNVIPKASNGGLMQSMAVKGGARVGAAF
jgi:hypothetical protein